MDAHAVIGQFGRTLENMEGWLDKAAKYAESRPFDVENLTVARLAPDQYPLSRQIQAGCDAAKFAAAYLAGRDAPSHPDVEKTLPELRQRIATVRAYLASFGIDDFAGASERRVSPRWAQGKWATGDEYLLGIAIPNFYFHMTTAYAILRHNGVPLGKRDFLGVPPFRE